MAKDEAQKKGTPAAEAAGPMPPSPIKPADATPAPAPAKTRTRLSFSKEKKLAYLTAGLVSILNSKPVSAVLSEEQKAKVVKAKTQADEIGGGDPFKQTTDRITAIQDELKAINYTDNAEKAIAQARELGKELDSQIKRKKQIEEMIGG